MVDRKVTSELVRWIVTLAQKGLPPLDTVKAMKLAGWPEERAWDVVSSALSYYILRTTEPLPTPAPAPPLAGNPLEIDGGDRSVKVLATVQNPPIVIFGDFLDDAECDWLIEEARSKVVRSTVVSAAAKNGEIHRARTSYGMFFRPGETEVLRIIEARIEKVLQWPRIKGEGMQVLRYDAGAEYKPHYDYFPPEKLGSGPHLERGGNRVGTLIMYLNDVAKGGGTVFPELGGFTAAAAPGCAIYFGYPIAHPTSKSLHGGAPVIDGEKWVAVKWLREHAFTG